MTMTRAELIHGLEDLRGKHLCKHKQKSYHADICSVCGLIPCRPCPTYTLADEAIKALEEAGLEFNCGQNHALRIVADELGIVYTSSVTHQQVKKAIQALRKQGQVAIVSSPSSPSPVLWRNRTVANPAGTAWMESHSPPDAHALWRSSSRPGFDFQSNRSKPVPKPEDML